MSALHPVVQKHTSVLDIFKWRDLTNLSKCKHNMVQMRYLQIAKPENVLKQWLSEDGPWTNSSSFTWELISSTNSCSSPSHPLIRNWGQGPEFSVLTRPQRCPWCAPTFAIHSSHASHSLTHQISESKRLYLPPPSCKVYTYLLWFSCIISHHPATNKWLTVKAKQSIRYKNSVCLGTHRYLACLYL